MTNLNENNQGGQQGGQGGQQGGQGASRVVRVASRAVSTDKEKRGRPRAAPTMPLFRTFLDEYPV